MFHYVYLLTFDDGMRYVGAHSTVIEPHLDTCYLGSGKALPPRTPQSCDKTILQVFNTREEAVKYEIDIIRLNNCVQSPDWYNLRLKTHDKHGSTLTSEHKKMISEAHKGRDRSDYGKRYTGAGRTPAQLAGDKRNSDRQLGTKNPAKGSLGTKNQGFKPWYYITPDGQYVEVHDRVKQEVCLELGFTYRQIINGFHYTNEHKKARTLPRKGWVFGNLPRPSNMAEG